MDPRAAFAKSSNSGQSNLQAHMALNSFVDQKNQEDNEAAIQEAMYYERLNQEAEKMLQPDRQRFDNVVAKMQGDIRSKIAMYGGNKKDFLQNGGHKVMQNFSSSIKNSPEYQTYIDNKQNYVKIKDAMEKGFGHLISIKDKKALENYEAIGDGKITYSGIMSEIKLPDDNNYNLGEDIPMTDILYNEDNYMKILGNYMMNYPEDKNPETKDLLGFMNIMGYGKKGSNRELLRNKQQMQLERLKDSLKDVKVKTDNRPQLFTTNILKMQEFIPKGTRVKDLFETEAGSYQPKNKINSLSKENTFLSANIDSEWNNDSYAVNEDEKGFDLNNDNAGGRWFYKNYGDRYRPAEANQIAPMHSKTIAEYFLNITPDESGNFKLDPAEISDMYSSKGIELKDDNNLEVGSYNTNYKNLGIITGLIANTSNGGKQMVMNVLDSDGEINIKKQKDNIDGLGDSEVKMGYFIALKNVDNERIYYKKINIEDTASRQGLSVKLGSADDLTNTIESSNRLEEGFQQEESQIAAAEQNFDEILLTIDSKVENSGNFRNESEMYANPNDTTQNRSSLIKSFYAITGFDTEGQKFHNFMLQFPETAKLVRTHGHNTTEEELIDILVAEMSQGEDQETVNSNKEIGKMWKNAYKRYLEINKE